MTELKQADSSITNTAAEKFNRSSDVGTQLHCSKNKGLFLLKQVKNCAWILRYTDATGKRRKITLGKYPSIKPRDAAYKARELTLGIYEGSDPQQIKAKKKEAARQRASQTLDAFLDGPYKLHQSRKKNEGKHTLNLIKSNFKDWLCLPMPNLTKHDVYNWQAKREQEVKRPTITRAYGALKTMLNFAASEGYISQNPLSSVSLLNQSAEKFEDDNIKTRRVLSTDELAALQNGLNAFEEQIRQQRRNSRKHGKQDLPDLDKVNFAHWFVPFFHCALHLGMRPGDLYNLRWEQVNLDFKRLVKTLEKTRHHPEPTKVDLPLNNAIHGILKNWQKQNGNPSTGLVFPSPVTGREFDRLAHSKSWEKVKKEAGASISPDLHFYSLRHHFISSLVSAGTPLFVVAKLAGHKSVKMIEQHYGHLAPSDAFDAMNKYEKSLNQTESNMAVKSP